MNARGPERDEARRLMSEPDLSSPARNHRLMLLGRQARIQSVWRDAFSLSHGSITSRMMTRNAAHPWRSLIFRIDCFYKGTEGLENGCKLDESPKDGSPDCSLGSHHDQGAYPPSAGSHALAVSDLLRSRTALGKSLRFS